MEISGGSTSGNQGTHNRSNGWRDFRGTQRELARRVLGHEARARKVRVNGAVESGEDFLEKSGAFEDSGGREHSSRGGGKGGQPTFTAAEKMGAPYCYKNAPRNHRSERKTTSVYLRPTYRNPPPQIRYLLPRPLRL